MGAKYDAMVSDILEQANSPEATAQFIRKLKEQGIGMQLEMIGEEDLRSEGVNYPDLLVRMNRLAKANSEKMRFVKTRDFASAASQREREVAIIKEFKELGFSVTYYGFDPVLFQAGMVDAQALRLRVFTLSKECEDFLDEYAQGVNGLERK